MFYSHEVLTSRKYGVATVWLVATLGSKSNLKKVSRKAILDVDVQKACDTIVTPHAPMALRLQSNLLYGITRVYAQQCGYVLNDAEAAKNSMRLVFKMMRTSDLDAEGGNKGRSDQLVLQDDPNFLPDFELVPLDLERFDLDTTSTGESQHSTLSPHGSQLTGVGTPQDIGGLDLPPSASSWLGGPVGVGGGISVRGDSGARTRMNAGGVLEDDLGLQIDDDGNLLVVDAPPSRQAPGPIIRGERTDLGSASSKIRPEQDEGQGAPNIFGQPDEDGFMPIQDDYVIGSDIEAFPARAATDQPQQITSEETAEAPARQRQPRKRQVVAMDANTELRNGDLARWQRDYVDIQNDVLHHKNTTRAATVAKENAKIWMLGQGDRGPLSMFQGKQLLEALTGMKLTATGEKRAREDEDGTDSDRRVRSRGEPSSDEIGRGFQDDGFMPMMSDDTIEQGREAPTPLDDRHLSSMMPWNQSAGSRRPTSVSAGGAAGPQLHPLAGRRSSRLASASPLMGRGAFGEDVDELQLPGSADVAMAGADEFELFGPGAQVDTQTAEKSQWERAALGTESTNFLEYVKLVITELDEAREQAGTLEAEDEELRSVVDFETLLPPESNNHIVAAQGLLHVLVLGTKNLLAVDQEETFGPINLRLI